MSTGKARKRRRFTPELKQEVVELCRRGDRSIGQVSRDLDPTEMSVRAWLKQAEIDSQGGSERELTSAEKQELSDLRCENRRLREEREIQKKAAAFFARENT